MDKDKVIFRDDVIVKSFALVVDGIPITLYSANGKIYTDERVASYDNYTHIKCSKCGEVFLKNSYCSPCVSKKEKEEWGRLPVKLFDNTFPVYSMSADKFFFDEESMVEYTVENDVTFESLMLTDCIEDRPCTLEVDYFNDGNYEEFDDECLASLIDEFNEEAKSILLGYLPGKNRIVFSDEFKDYFEDALASIN